jgi:hypothetical protein
MECYVVLTALLFRAAWRALNAGISIRRIGERGLAVKREYDAEPEHRAGLGAMHAGERGTITF